MARARQIPGISPGDSFAEVAARVVEVRSKEIFEPHGELLSVEDPGAVHDMRVATRRLRAALEVFEPCFPRRRLRRARRALGELADALGERRDRDIQIQWLRDQSPGDGDERAALEAFLEQLRAEQQQANVALALALEELGHQRLDDQLTELAPRARRRARGGRGRELKLSHRDRSSARGEGSPEPSPSASLREGASLVIAKRCERLYRVAAPALRESETAALHKMRIEAKRLRYTLELTSFCFGPYAAEAGRRARELQDAIGAIHDLDVVLPRLLAHEGARPFVARQRQHRGALYAAFRERWSALEREGFRERLMGALEEPPDEPPDEPPSVEHA
jgi:CHAD domain-containing protein